MRLIKTKLPKRKNQKQLPYFLEFLFSEAALVMDSTSVNEVVLVNDKIKISAPHTGLTPCNFL